MTTTQTDITALLAVLDEIPNEGEKIASIHAGAEADADYLGVDFDMATTGRTHTDDTGALWAELTTPDGRRVWASEDRDDLADAMCFTISVCDLGEIAALEADRA